METAAAGKGKDRLRERAASVEHGGQRRFEIAHLDHGQWRADRFRAVRLNTDIGIPGRGGGIAGAECGELPAKRALIKSFAEPMSNAVNST